MSIGVVSKYIMCRVTAQEGDINKELPRWSQGGSYFNNAHAL